MKSLQLRQAQARQHQFRKRFHQKVNFQFLQEINQKGNLQSLNEFYLKVNFPFLKDSYQKEIVDLTKGEASYAKFMKGRHEERTKRLAALQAMKAAREEAHQQEAKVEEATEKEDEVELHVVQTGKPKEKTMAKKPRRRRTGTIKGK
eukprot:s7132_g1.t1